MFCTGLCACVFVLGLLPSTLCVQCLHYVPLLLTGEVLHVLLAWDVVILSAFSRARKSFNNSWAQVDFAVGRIELAQVDEMKQEANKVPPWINWLGSRFCGEAMLLCLSAILSAANSFLLQCCFISRHPPSLWNFDLLFFFFPSFGDLWVLRVLQGLFKLRNFKSGSLHPSLTPMILRIPNNPLF